MLGHLKGAAEESHKHWPAAMTLLERRIPNEFGRNQRIDINETRTVNVNVTADLTEGQIATMLQALAEGQPRSLPLLTDGSPSPDG